MIYEILTHTPTYVWLLFAFLLYRGISGSQEREVNILMSLIVPGIFILWGMYNVFANFSFPLQAFIAYIVFAGLGTFLGYELYRRNYHFFLKNGVVFRAKNYLPLVVILINFVIKYALNIYMYMQSGAIHSLGFNVFYTIISGTTVGLFLGGILNTNQQKGKLLGSLRKSRIS
ncbi:hypothetical protein SAMN05444162_4319 [Paenibacillaceae bacterium GAS479]|nr:hypothetical protein SAMN05444162_4319 [Paenibacillaceae bacterium GAS479]